MSTVIEKDIVVIGAGLTGLTLAFYLKKHNKDVLVIEKSDRTGGVIHTENENGFVYETGPNTGVVGNPEVAELFEDLKGLCTFEGADPSAKRRLIWKGNKWHAIPSGLISAIGTPLFTLKDKFRVLGEPFRKPGTNPEETLTDFVKRRLGVSFLNYAVDPFISGVYAGNTDYLIPKYALPKLYALEQNYGSFIRGSMQKAKEKKNDPRLQKATKEVFSAKGGLGKLIDALTQKVGNENILLNAENTSVSPEKAGFKITTTLNGERVEINAKKVVTTTGAYALPAVLPFLEKAETEPFEALKYASVVQAIVGFKNWQGMSLKAFGGLVPSRENKKILGALFTSSFFVQRAPEGGAVISVFMGGTRRPEIYEMSDQEIHSLLESQAREMLEIPDFKPDLLKIFRYKHAIPQYGLDSKRRFETINKLQEKYPGLYLAGNIRDGIGMADRIKQARTLAEELAK
ncbi:protoporphyrinogen oxidase [Maribellus sediminis]|uniref:protoporphyrinogen oxidase n=1 Tax=Maribellus sediminis TaxID=2696285 RepID=UPI00142F974F|nr:protoporphyrinogen oxidase [Maribellus sediminis]